MLPISIHGFSKLRTRNGNSIPIGGDETISLAGFTGNKAIVGQLPGWQPILTGQGAREATQPSPMKLDTVEVDLDRKRLYLTWRAVIDQSLQTTQASIRLHNTA
jgi:hypothetical protein